jgi:chorismate dehydratase
VDRSAHYTYDLAEEWIRFTGKPFVFAFWAVRKTALHDAGDIARIFRDSRDHGLIPGNLKQLAALWAPRLSMTEVDILRYLTENIYYYLDPGCLDGLTLFYEYAAQCGILPPAPELRFHDQPRPVMQ